MSDKTISRIDNEIPYSHEIRGWLHCSAAQSFESFCHLAGQYERQYLAWQEVRKGVNPYLENGTGFEGYFVGSCSSPEETLSSILDVGQHMLSSLTRLHRFEPRFLSTLLSTLMGERISLKAMSEWSAEYGAALARLRCKVLGNPQAEAFHTEVYHLVDRLPPITYDRCDQNIRQHYLIACCNSPASRLVVNSSMFSSPQQDAWLVVQTIGKYGHPLIREFMDLATN